MLTVLAEAMGLADMRCDRQGAIPLLQRDIQSSALDTVASQYTRYMNYTVLIREFLALAMGTTKVRLSMPPRPGRG